jgi:hypothetical protein
MVAFGYPSVDSAVLLFPRKPGHAGGARPGFNAVDLGEGLELDDGDGIVAGKDDVSRCTVGRRKNSACASAEFQPRRHQPRGRVNDHQSATASLPPLPPSPRTSQPIMRIGLSLPFIGVYVRLDSLDRHGFSESSGDSMSRPERLATRYDGNARSSGVRPSTMSNHADSSPVFDLLIGMKSTRSSSLSNRSSPPLATRSTSLPGCLAMFIWEVSRSRSPFLNVKWICGAGRAGERA